MPAIVGWGSSPWGGSAWGGASGGAQALLSALAVRENVVRAAFSQPVYFSGILDPPDASDPRKYALAPVAGTVGIDNEPVRPATVIAASLPTAAVDGIPPSAEGRWVDLTLDRPLSAEGALYDLTVVGVAAVDLSTVVASDVARVDAVYRLLSVPTADVPLPTRDFAAAQAVQPGADDPVVGVEDAELGTYRYGDDRDYAVDDGIASLRKRIIRRGITRKNAFAHLPGYGVGIPDLGKRLLVAAVLTATAADYEAQIVREPDVAKAKVTPIVDPAHPGLVRFRVAVRPKVGKPKLFTLSFPTSA